MEETQLMAQARARVLRLDYISCVLTIASTLLVGRRMWQGWLVAGANSLIICWIGMRTTQTGFIPANLFCLAIYSYNIVRWRNPLRTRQLAGTKLREGLTLDGSDVVRVRNADAGAH